MGYVIILSIHPARAASTQPENNSMSMTISASAEADA